MRVSLSKKVKNNLDVETVNNFDDEWSQFDQSELPKSEASKRFDEYFADITKTKDMLGWKPEVVPSEGISKMVQWITSECRL